MQILTRPLPCLELSLSQFLFLEGRGAHLAKRAAARATFPRALGLHRGSAGGGGWGVGGVAVGERAERG